MDEHLTAVKAASAAYAAAQEQVTATRQRLAEALQEAYKAGLRTDLIQQAAGLPASTMYRLMGGVRR